MVTDMYDQFVGMVAAGRQHGRGEVRDLADGRAFTGRQALALGLVDAIGGEREARDWLAPKEGVPTDLPVATSRPRPRPAEALSAQSRLDARSVWKSLVSQGLAVDGAGPLWQRSGN